MLPSRFLFWRKMSLNIACYRLYFYDIWLTNAWSQTSCPGIEGRFSPKTGCWLPPVDSNCILPSNKAEIPEIKFNVSAVYENSPHISVSIAFVITFTTCFMFFIHLNTNQPAGFTATAIQNSTYLRVFYYFYTACLLQRSFAFTNN